jgi:DNA-binding response OmpR family regulator
MLDIAVSRVLNFDRFSLDLARGCLRMGDQDLELRPKTFEVLKYLAMNAGRLVAKQPILARDSAGATAVAAMLPLEPLRSER